MASEDGARGARDALPCLNRNNSIEPRSEEGQKSLQKHAFNRLTSAHRKVAFALDFNVQQLSKEFGIERLGFLTLTFATPVHNAKEASRRFNSLNTNVLKRRYEKAITVLERQKSGRIHFHSLVVLAVDIRSGVDFEKLEALCGRKDKPKHWEWEGAGVSDQLFSEWAFWRETAPRYGFGRHELKPVRSNADAISHYVGKYIAKHIDQREERDKGVRLVRYSQGSARASSRFAWNSPGSDNFRRKLRWLCEGIGCTPRNYRAVFRQHFGEKWFWRILGPLFQVRFNWYPTVEHFTNDWPEYLAAFERDVGMFLCVRIERVAGEDSPGTVEIVKGGDAEARQRACLEMLTADLEEQKRRSEMDVARHVPKFQEFVRTATAWLHQSLPYEADQILSDL